jgi:hypothetical protein
VCGFACFDELRTQKPGNTTPMFAMCCILHPHKGISSHMMGEVVLGEKLPYPMLGSFLVDGSAKGLKCFGTHH